MSKGTCPECGREITLRAADGMIRTHGSKRKGVWPPENCTGSGKAPRKD